jgi:hypothetical protein
MKTILFSLIASLALVSPAMGQTASHPAPFSEVIAKVEALKAANNAVDVANKVRLELANGTPKKVVLNNKI